MILNIDLGSLYVKVALIEPKTQQFVTGEIVRMEKSTINVVEVLLTSIITNYTRRYDVRRIYITPNTNYIDCEIIDYESVTDEKYVKIMKDEINRVRKEEKKKKRMGAEYEPPKVTQGKSKYTPIRFSKELDDVEIFHQIERNNLMSSQIYIEYIDREYLKSLSNVIKGIDKEILLISPIRAMKYYPLPKGNRIIINYGHRSILTSVIEVDTEGREYFKEISKEVVQDSLFEGLEVLESKHEQLSLDKDPVYKTKIQDIKRLKERYKGYPVYSVGGNAGYLQNDMMLENTLAPTFNLPPLPEVMENTMISSFVTEYKDFPYNSLQMQMKNKILSAMNISNQVATAIGEVSGDLAVALLIMALVGSYHITNNYEKHSSALANINTQIANYEGSSGRLASIEEQIEALKTGRTKNYYNVAELLETLASPLEIEKVEIKGKDIKIVAYADNVALIQQFLESVKAKQVLNDYTKFTLWETDVTTVFRDGKKLDRV